MLGASIRKACLVKNLSPTIRRRKVLGNLFSALLLRFHDLPLFVCRAGLFFAENPPIFNPQKRGVWANKFQEIFVKFLKQRCCIRFFSSYFGVVLSADLPSSPAGCAQILGAPDHRERKRMAAAMLSTIPFCFRFGWVCILLAFPFP